MKTYTNNGAKLRARLEAGFGNNKHIQKWMNGENIKLYVLDEKCFAFVSFFNSESNGKEWCILEYIYTLPSFRRLRFGNDVIQRISKDNSNVVSLCYHESNLPFFEACGFVQKQGGEWIKCH